MRWLSKREKLDPVQASAMGFVVTQKGLLHQVIGRRC